MKTDESSEPHPEFRLFAGSEVALREQCYREALETLQKELIQAIKIADQLDSSRVLQSFLSIVIMLEMNLERAYGERWEELIPKISQEAETLRCSFCDKTQKEVTKLIASATAYICNECIDICNEIIEDDKKYKERMNEQNNER
jgi:hypothetical protein